MQPYKVISDGLFKPSPTGGLRVVSGYTMTSQFRRTTNSASSPPRKSRQSVGPRNFTDPTPERVMHKSLTDESCASERLQRSGDTAKPPRLGRPPFEFCLTCGSSRSSLGLRLGGLVRGELRRSPNTEETREFSRPCAVMPPCLRCRERRWATARHQVASAAAGGHLSSSRPSTKAEHLIRELKCAACTCVTRRMSKSRILYRKLPSNNFRNFAHFVSVAPRRTAAASITWQTTAGGCRKDRNTARSLRVTSWAKAATPSSSK
mmetsp:Transcript_48231/g.112877  ORF Transcript_48231/g.112877 Transcript_48231/m.112877 type:complete len:263 (-) Transcript_48231:1028-1816(-)